MTRKDSKIVFCGLPCSGKTTFLGALSYLVENNEDSSAMKLTGLNTQKHFFNNLADTWVSCDEMHRTNVNSKDSIEMSLSNGSIHFDIEMPDLSGESWASIWAEHEITHELNEFISQCGSVALFVHTEQIVTPMTISEENSMLRGRGLNEDVVEETEEWDSTKHASTQSISVDLLIKLSSMMDQGPKKVAIILSAWDKVTTGTKPIDFMRVQLPLLFQYLSAKLDYNDFNVYGVSAQGGCLDEPEQKQRLINIDEPTERIVVSEDGTNQYSDLTKILSWLVND